MEELDYTVIFEKMARGELSAGEVPDVTRKKIKLFRKMVVLEVISDAKEDSENEETQQRWNTLGILNFKYAKALPRNSIIAKDVGYESAPEFVLPFFSHVSMPCKAGECVWVISESDKADISYWLSRVVELHLADDVNHSHPGRYLEPSQNPSTSDKFKGKGDKEETTWFELRNGPPVEVDQVRNTSSKRVLLRRDPEDIFEQLVTGSKAAEITYYESVPRFKKRPGDVALEGSNNTLIVLGNDRQGGLKKTPFTSSAGSIDLVAGRGQTNNTYGKSVDTTSIIGVAENKKGKKIKEELDKTEKSLSKDEGDPDFINDRSRILVSHRTSVDKNFKLDTYNKKLGIEDNAANGDAGIVIKSDKVRLIARSDVEIIVTGFKNPLREAPDKKKIKDEELEDQEKWASITITSSGEIVIKPSKTGVIKLGSEKANKAILCTQSVNNGVGGNVIGKPIATTMGGQVGFNEGSPTGEWAKKVLID